ncbi:hypothetical protein LSH36_2107g00010 [Paralvinella palmiformis]|uniref:LRP5_6 n=1 Tax=Paralvinella palmiformis TaxID=53620 RepID=A0AAD9IR57_9ANNE|nr:hypothetical protein LSH36_2107g00010 [Paralvinella palmiformis]
MDQMSHLGIFTIFIGIVFHRKCTACDFHGYATYIPVVNVSDITVIEHDPTEGYVYWGDNDLAIISRARLNGTDEETLITNVHPASLAIDAESQMMYWIDNINNSILRSNTNGSNKETLIQYSLSGPNSIVLDTTNGKMYWTETTPRIQRANLNGTDIEELVNGSLGMPLVLTLNPSAGRMYWADGEKGHFMSSDMDGQNSKEMFVKEIDPIAMALYGDAIFLMDKKDDKYLIIHCNISETNGDVKTVFSLPSFSIYGMTSGTTNEGKDLKVLVKGPHKADAERNLALSLDTSEIFWTNENMDCISRMTFSAENKTCLNVSTDQPTGIALDEENRALYWTESRNDGTIQRSSYTGDDQVTLVSNLKSPFGISIDIANNRMYWTQNDYTIGVALLNGTEVGTIQVPRDRNEVMTKIGKSLYGIIFYCIHDTTFFVSPVSFLIVYCYAV